MSLTLSQLLDTITFTEDNYNKGKITDVSHNIRRFIFLPTLVRNKRRMMTGINFKWPLIHTGDDSAKAVGYLEEDVIQTRDHGTMCSVDLRHTTANYAYDLKQEMHQQDGKDILNLVKLKRYLCYVDIHKKWERWGLGKPTNSSDGKTPLGIQNWVVPNASEGYYGQNAYGFSSGPGGVDSSATQYANYRNWTGTYSTISKTDLITKMRTAAEKTFFMTPVEFPQNAAQAMMKYQVLTNYTVKAGLEAVGESVNDNLGRDLAMFQGKITFHGNPIIAVPAYESGSDAAVTVVDGSGNTLTNPIYMLNWDTFVLLCLKDFWDRRTGPEKHPTCHTGIVYYIDNSGTLICLDRRGNSVFYQA